MDDLSVFDARLKTPFRMLLAGASESGKTTFVLNLLKDRNRLVTTDFDYIVWFYGMKPPKINDSILLSKIQFVSGVPENLDNYLKKNLHGLLIFDDLMRETENDEMIAAAFTARSHHQYFSIIVITQNLFSRKASDPLTLGRNATYITLFNTPLDLAVGGHMGRRLMPKKPKIFSDIYESAVNRPHGYLFIDGHQDTPKDAKFRTDIFDPVMKCFLV